MLGRPRRAVRLTVSHDAIRVAATLADDAFTTAAPEPARADPPTAGSSGRHCHRRDGGTRNDRSVCPGGRERAASLYRAVGCRSARPGATPVIPAIGRPIPGGHVAPALPTHGLPWSDPDGPGGCVGIPISSGRTRS